MSAIAVTVGTFDGVHRGHRRLFEDGVRLAALAGLDLVALTFDRHPLSLLHPERAPRLLTGLDHKIELLGAVDGVARTEVLVFDQARADQAPESFIADTLIGGLGARLLVVGGNFRFGRAGAGDVALAERVGRRLGLAVRGTTLLEGTPGSVVSSSEIRRLVATGSLDGAARLLGRPHEVRGELRLGEPAGRVAELVVPGELLLPPPGRYEVRAGPLREDAVALIAALAPPGGPGAPVLLEAPPATSVPEAWPRGTTVRIAFETPATPPPPRAPVVEQASERAGDR